METSRKLNTDILTEIVKYIDVENIYIACKCLMPDIPIEETKRIRNYRLNPMVLLRDITSEPEALLVAMGLSGTLLSGSRASNYFYPGMASPTSDWDFYYSKDVKPIKAFFSSIGVTWLDKDIADILHPLHVSTQTYLYNEYIEGVIKHENTFHNIQLIGNTFNSGKPNPFKSIVNFHSSIVQCFICASGAVSMYNSLTARGKSIPWKVNENTVELRDKTRNCREKYVSRGVKYISYDWYTGLTKDCSTHCIDLQIIEKRKRTVRSKDTSVILFNKYYSEKTKQVLGLLDYILDPSSILDLSWYELPYKCFYLPNNDDKLQVTIPKSMCNTISKLETMYPELSSLLCAVQELYQLPPAGNDSEA